VSSAWKPLEGSAQAIALEVLVYGPLARSELARRVGLSQASLTRLANPLVASGLLVEVEAASDGTRMGRPTRPLDIVPTSHHFVGVKLTGDAAYGVVTTLRAELVATCTEALPDHDPATVVSVVARLVAKLSAEVPDVAGLGVSLGGSTSDSFVVASAPWLGWTGVPLASLLGAATHLPVVVENDLAALTEAERWFGAGRTNETFALLTIGAGVGYGLVVQHRRVTHEEARIGLIGHQVLDESGPRCAAGHRGCASAMLTTGGIQGAVSAALGRWVEYDEALALVRAGDPVAEAVFGDAGRALGRLVATIANFTLVQTVVLGGEGVALAEIAAAQMEGGLAACRDPQAAPVTLLVRAGDFTEWARGAAVVAIQAFVMATDKDQTSRGVPAVDRRARAAHPVRERQGSGGTSVKVIA